MIIIKSFYKEKLKVKIFEKKEQMGLHAASFVTENLKAALAARGHANLILGTGASQYPLISALLDKDIDWAKINLFHLDEYIGLSDRHPASFRRFLRERVTERIVFNNVYYLNGDAVDMDAEKIRYADLLKNNPVDVACIGIGENGHIAFNDPPIADFEDTQSLKVVELDHACRMQQVNEGWFPTIEDVPRKAVTLTIPTIMRCKTLCCTVPDKRKAEAVYNALTYDISTSFPASILRTHENAVLFLDEFAAMKILNNNLN